MLGAAATLPATKEAKRRVRRAGVDRPDATSRAIRAMRRRPLVIVVVLLLIGFGPPFVQGLKKTPQSKVGISYGGGPFEGAHFQRIVNPGHSLFFNGWFDPLYLYPADEQNYIVSLTFGQGAIKAPDSITATTSDRVPIQYQVAAYFKLNIDRLRAFHEQLGLTYRAYTTRGWNNLIQDTFRQNIENALQIETRRYTIDQIVGSSATLVALQGQVQTDVTQALDQALGQPFFCGPTYVRHGTCGPITFVFKGITIPTTVQAAYNAIAQRTNEAKAIDVFAGALDKVGQNYVLLKAIESGSVNFWVIPSGTGLTLQTPTGSTSTPSVPSSPGSSGSTSSGTSTTTSTSTTTTAPASGKATTSTTSTTVAGASGP